ncbi:MAG: T9SS type A sorting domain-containing protein [Chitinophagaceae bacterium]|nr:T9SS type A sorting domain-containing protein [Chitinophagaceae bacterium]
MTLYTNPKPMEKMDPINELSLHPNPATTKVNVTAKRLIREISIMTITGREVLNRSGSNRFTETVPIGILPKGLYHVKVTTDSNTSQVLLYKTG